MKKNRKEEYPDEGIGLFNHSNSIDYQNQSFSDTNCERCYLYTKNRRAIEPIHDKKLNAEARLRLSDLYSKQETLCIPRKFLTQWEKVSLICNGDKVEKANMLYLKEDDSTYALNNSLNDLTSKEWLNETVTVFTQKGLGSSSKEAQIEKLHPAPFSFQDVARLIRFFTKENQVVLDPFVGVGSTLKACAFENRRGIGFELNEKYYQLSIQRIKEEISDEFEYKNQQQVLLGDCRDLILKYNKDSFDFIITSPPYWNILETIDHKVKQNRISNDLDTKYSDHNSDFSNISNYDIFLEELAAFFNLCGNYLNPRKYMVIIVSDFRKKEKYHLFHADLAKEIEKGGKFNLKGIRILYQKFKSIYPYGYPFSFVPNVHHQNVLIFQKTI